jgi:hypothetical protein
MQRIVGAIRVRGRGPSIDCQPLTPTLSHKGRGIFSDYRFSYFISIRC